jgi:hypothetical protein
VLRKFVYLLSRALKPTTNINLSLDVAIGRLKKQPLVQVFAWLKAYTDTPVLMTAATQSIPTFLSSATRNHLKLLIWVLGFLGVRGFGRFPDSPGMLFGIIEDPRPVISSAGLQSEVLCHGFTHLLRIARASGHTQGPFSWNTPIIELLPGPPLIHTVKGASFGSTCPEEDVLILTDVCIA